MDDGTVLDTNNATASWDEAQRHDGNNWISIATGTQWDHERLYRSKKGRYYLEHTSQWQGRLSRAEWISKHQAAAWLLANNESDLPEDLEAIADEVSE
jgi:hypothetical protein